MEDSNTEISREQRVEQAALRLRSEEREGNSNEVLGNLNYYKHAKQHPQKDESIIAGEIYEQLEKLGTFITAGTTDQDLKDIKDVANKANLDSEKIVQMLTVYTQRNYPDGLPDDSVYALFIDPRNNFPMPIIIPQKPE